MIPGGPEILIVLAVVLLLFGAKRIPELARSWIVQIRASPARTRLARKRKSKSLL